MEITTAEKLFLLSLDDSGRDVLGLGADAGFAAALVADLAGTGHFRIGASLHDSTSHDSMSQGLTSHGLPVLEPAGIEVEDVVVRPGPTSPRENPLARDAYDIVASVGPALRLADALKLIVQELAPLGEAIAAQLVDEGVVGTERGRLGGVVRVVRHPVTAPATAQAARDELRLALTPGAALAPSPQAALLLAVLRPFGRLDALVPKERRGEAAARAAELIDSSPLARAAGLAVTAMRSRLVAVLAASVAP